MKSMHITIYRTVRGAFTVEVPEGADEEKTIRSYLLEPPPGVRFEGFTDDFAEIEREDGTKETISLSGASAFQRID
jgi:hypothetical protein